MPPLLRPSRWGGGARSDTREWVLSVAVAVLLHVVALAVLTGFGRRSPTAPPASPQAAMTVDLAPMAASPDVAESQMPDGPEQVEQQAQPEEIRPEAFDPPPEVAGPPPPDALPMRKPTPPVPPTEKRETVEATTAPAAAISPVRDALAAPAQGAASNAAASNIDVWEGRLLAHLNRHKRYPAAARAQRQEDTIYVRFMIDRKGRVLGTEIKRSRGYPALESEVMALFRRASPLPPPPDNMGGNPIDMVVPIDFFLRAGGR